MEDLKPNPNELPGKRYYVTLRGKTVYESDSLDAIHRYYDSVKPSDKRFIVVHDLNQLKLW